MIERFEQILLKLDEWTNSTEELSSVMESLVSRLREPVNGIPAASVLVQTLLKPLSENRERTGIESVIGKISSICGPELVFKELPLKLLEDDTNSWLLALLGKPGYVMNTELNHFVKVLIPLSEGLFERRRIALKENLSLEAKKCETVVNQIWSLLPGYCDLPRDLIQSFTKPFAELLSQILYTQPTLRSSVLRALRNLVDRNLSLSKSVPEPADQQLIRNFGISSKDAEGNVQHLSSLASNMSKVMFNLLSKLERKDSVRSLLVETIGSWIKVLSEDDFSQIWSMISTSIKRSSTQSQDPTNKLPTTLEIMLDIYSILLPRLPRPIAIESLELIGSETFLMGFAQKKAYRILCTALEFNKLSDELIEVLMKRVVLIGRDHSKQILGGAKPISSNRFDLMVLMISEVVLGCKETNSETREIAYKTLVRMGNRMKNEPNAMINHKLLEEEEEMGEGVVVKASIDEFLKIVSAGLAGGSPHMIAATMMALSRVIFEFHNDLSNESIQEILRIILIFLTSSNNREIIKTTISLIKVLVICLPNTIIEENLNQIIKGLVKWGDEHKNEIKKSVRFLLERLVKKFEFNQLINALESRNGEDGEDEGDGIDVEGGKKLLGSVKKNYEREKKKKKESLKKRKENETNGDEMDEDGEAEQKEEADNVGGGVVKKSLNDAYEQALYGSDDSDSESEVEGTQQKKGKGKGKGTGIEMMIDEGEDEVIDLLDPTRITKRAIAGKLAKLERRKDQLSKHAKKFEKDSESGKMKIEESEESEKEERKKVKKKTEEEEGFNAYLEAIEGEDGMYRDEKGKMRFKKPNAKRDREVLSDGDEGNEEGLMGLVNGLDLNSQKKKKKVKKEKLGSEFKSKKAGGDMIQKKGVSPFAYLPMNDVSGKKGKKKKGEIDITGKKRGSASK
ncbi:NUC173 domain-containing protein [Melampsora americana]|nr:NUC173 domain-containing protein [Melampsora americana]